MPFVASGALAGASLVGGDHESSREADLQRAAALLSRVLEDCLGPPDARRTTSQRLAALHELLEDARAKASERDVFCAFAEIMNVWDDAEVVGYRGDLSGHYVLTAALPGTDRAALPESIAADALPPGAIVNLSASMQQQFGFAGMRFPILIRVSTAGGPWLMAATHRPGSRQLPEWFDFYVAALAESLNASLEIELAQATWAIMHHLVENESPREALTHAIRGIAEMLAARCNFTMWDADGTPTLTVGEALQPSAGNLQRPELLRVRIEAPGGRHARLEMRPNSPHQFTRRDLKLFDAAVWTLSRWFSISAEQLAGTREAATPTQSFDEVVDRCLRTRRRMGASSLILIMPEGAELSSDLAYEWIQRVRSQLRPTDLAGRLRTGEVAVVAVETNGPGALVVARRIARVLSDSTDPLQAGVRVGLAAGDERASAHGLIAEARQHLIDA